MRYKQPQNGGYKPAFKSPGVLWSAADVNALWTGGAITASALGNSSIGTQGKQLVPSSNTLYNTYTVSLPATSDYTLAWYGDTTGVASGAYVFSFGLVGTNLSLMLHDNVSPYGWGVWNGSFLANTDLVPSGLHLYVATKKNGVISFYRDGVLKGTVSDATATAAVTGVAINSYSAGTSGSYGVVSPAYHLYAFYETRGWSAGEVLALSRNPWSIFKSSNKVLKATASGAVSISESTSSSDAPSCFVAYAPASSESATAADALTAVNSSIESLTETASGADTPIASNSYTKSIPETASSVDSTSAVNLASVSTAESATGTDAATVSAIMVVSNSETASGSDTPSATDTAGGAQNVSEAATAADTPATTALAVVSGSEAATAVDAETVSSVMPVSVTDVAAGTDAGAVGNSTSVSGSEAAAASDAVSVLKTLASAVAEAAAASEAATATAFFVSSVAEAVAALDNGAAAAVFYSAAIEAAATTDITAYVSLLNAALTDAASAADTSSALSFQGVITVPPHMYVLTTSNGVHILTTRAHIAAQSGTRRIAILSAIQHTAV